MPADVQAAAVLRWAPAALVPRGVVAAVPAESTGGVTLHWGDATEPTDSGGAAVVRHTYAAAGAYTVSAVHQGSVIATGQVVVRDGLAPTVTFAAGTDNQLIIDATFNDDPAEVASRYEIGWGDGSAAETLWAPKGTVRSHGYRAGTYTIVVRDLHTGRALSSPVTVVDRTYDPDFTIAKGANANTATATLSTVAVPGKDVLIDWGDGAQDTITKATVGNSVSHSYTAADTYIVQCAYTDGSTEGSAKTVTIPFPAKDTDR